ncbi:hypothetical protein FQK07_14870 [Synechococcus sp. BSF8S]|uniref:DUF6492 family protein n=1 Tax=Synechococcales TaxID=1890424 RepID=UPI001629CD46|nr:MULTISPECIES: DUF6492 family protein [unclassified Synechococcus]MBC1262506.1 hypothetical protein [Synechococcus sp. BSF8S]MBC1265388.1 hypothetical protein [Synechococcus sp. BSA11S]
MSNKISLVVVVYDKEVLELLFLLQSINMLFKLEGLHKIYIAIQGDFELRKEIQKSVDMALTELSPFIIYLSQSALLGAGIKGRGWYLQQVLKLKAASLAESDYSLTLDCKNHFVNYSSAADFLNNGKPIYAVRSERSKLKNIDSILGKAFINAHRVYQLDYSQYIDESLGAVTPFVLGSREVTQMMHDLEKRYHKNFPELFINDLNTAEFYLYAAYLRSHQDFDASILIRSEEISSVVWESSVDDFNSIKAARERVLKGKQKIFGIHKRAYGKISNSVMNDICEIWSHRGLDPNQFGYKENVLRAHPAVRS